MQHNFENSSSLKSAEYDSTDKILTITFNSGSSYRYRDVPKEVYQELIEAKSAGKFFQSYIKSKYVVIE